MTTASITVPRAIGDRIIVTVNSESDVTDSGIIVMTDRGERVKVLRGEVIAVGEGHLTQDSKRHPLLVRPGETIIFSKDRGLPFMAGNRQYLSVAERDVLAVL